MEIVGNQLWNAESEMIDGETGSPSPLEREAPILKIFLLNYN
jgi:hypothetical protein